MKNLEIRKTVADVAQALTGKRPSPVVVWRWVTYGLSGVILQADSIGGKWMLSEAMFEKWVADVGNARRAKSASKRAARLGASSTVTTDRTPEVAKSLAAAGLT